MARTFQRVRKQYHRDLKLRVVHQYYTLMRSTTQIAIDLDMSLRVVQRVLQVWSKLGDVTCRARNRGRVKTMTGVEIEFMMALLDRDPDLFLDEISDALMEQHDLDISLSTVYRTLKYMGYGSKKLSKAAQERNEDKRALYLMTIGQESAERLVFIDESAVNVKTTYRLNGWSFRGQRARKTARFVRGQRYSLLPALSLEGVIYSKIIEDSFDGAAFCAYLEALMMHMNPYPGKHSVLVMDNCAIHHVDEVEDICAERGVKVSYLPPYSPDFNPDEECFSSVKSYIRRNGLEFRTIIDLGDELAPFEFLYRALMSVTAKKARGWFRHAGYI